MTDTESRTAALEERTTALETADHLVESLNQNTKALDRVRRKYRWTMALLAIVAITLITVIKFNYDGAIERCESGNELRVEIDDKWDAITTFLKNNDTGGITPGEQAFLNLLSDDLGQRDCSDINWLGR